MCGRFTLHHSSEQIARRFDVQRVLFNPEPRYNIAPSQPIAAVTLDSQGRKLSDFRWGLVPFWAKDVSIGNKMINARVETLNEKASFKYALKQRRCLIPADGFYEWKDERATSNRKQPMHIRFEDQRLFAFAGLWEEWRSKDEADAPIVKSCTIITGPPNALLATLHHRMAVILRPEDEAKWLDPNLQEFDDLWPLLQPLSADEMEAYAIDSKINAPAYDAPDCIAPMSEEAEIQSTTSTAQPSLF